MSSLTLALKRKSIQKIQPMLPKATKLREPSPNGRTIYQQFKPSQLLKQFRKKQCYTYGNLSTDKSLSNLNSQQYRHMKNSRFDDDHHNTESMEQLMDTKMGSNIPTTRTKVGETVRKSITTSQEKISSKKQSLQSESLTIRDDQNSSKQKQEKGENIEQAEAEVKEGQNYDDYVLGEKIDEAEEDILNKETITKKYLTDKGTGVLNAYIPHSESQLRLQAIHVNNQRKRLLQLKQDQQIIAMMHQYQNHKQNVINQSRKKHQTTRIIASIQPAPRIQKSFSLPALKPKRQILVPQIQQNTENKAKRNIIAKGLDKFEPFVDNRLKYTLSSGKLGFGKKKVRTICQQEVYDDEMNSMEEIRIKLRSKGIKMDSNTLVKGLVNIKNELQYGNIVNYPQKTLPSNPIYKKFPL